MKKHTSLLLSALMLFSSLFGATVQADENQYLTRSQVCDTLLSAAEGYNDEATAQTLMQGYDEGEKLATREEALVMLKRAFGDIPPLKGANLMAAPKEEFTDLSAADKEELSDVVDAGIVAGTGDNTLNPEGNITKSQLDRFIERTYNVFGSDLKDNFFAYVNKEELDNATLNSGYSAVGSIYSIDYENNIRVKELIKETAAKSVEEGTGEYYIKTLYNNILNMQARNDMGYEPIKEYLDKIDGANSLSELSTLNEELYKELGFSVMNFGFSEDLAESTSYILCFVYPSASFDKTVYNGGNPTTENAYRKYVKKLLMLCGESEEQAQRDVDYNFEFEKRLAENSLEPQEYYDAEKTYNIYTLEEIDSVFKNVDIEGIFNLTGVKTRDRIMVPDVKLMEENARLFDDENLDMLKAVFKASLIHSYAGCFGEDFKKARDDYKMECTGVSENYDSETDATVQVMNMLPEYMGKVYADKYDSEETNKEINSIIDDVKKTYEEKISNLDWMSDTTKQRAITKLKSIKAKVGAPTKWKDILNGYEFKSFEEGGSLFQNYVAITKANNADNLKKEGTKVDKEEWVTSPYTVNAFYDPTANDITITAAILNAPIYSKDMSYEEKLGGIGYVIGHEISHAFDSNGSKYDEKGNVADWWTQEDKATFMDLCQGVVDFYNGSEAATGILNDPELTLTENIADLGAVSCLTTMGEKQENFDFKKMYEAVAGTWAMAQTRERIQNLATSDVHSAPRLRVNKVVQSVDKFYEVYDIKEGDGMYISPEERARIW
ncbi:MAG: S-layer homology domain-containing protein [Firmicutes bacterium]|nr:S-layer homology domain-containing protein [Bacillota bacterium]